MNIIKEKREAKGMTQEQLSAEVKIGRTTIAMYETDAIKPSVPVAQSIGKVLEFDWTKIFDEGGAKADDRF